MDFLKIDSNSYTPVYVQIQDGIKHAIESGVLKPGQQLPSIREFARSLKVNPNTATKALNNLVMQGVITSRQGLGCFVAEGQVNSGTSCEAERFSLAQQQEDYTPTYIRIRNDFLSKILDGSLPPGSCLPSLREIAQEYNVNLNTVTKALDALKYKGCVRSTRGVGYRVNESGRNEGLTNDSETEKSTEGESTEESTLGPG